ncbi:MAG: NAD kinase [Actinobacteria bacterium]|nr:NAD kinase [Actinomycetota bacterium]
MNQNRNVLLVAHTGRADAVAACTQVIQQLVAAGLVPVMTPEQLVEIDEFLTANNQSRDVLTVVKELGVVIAEADLELVMVLGGDGTILKAAEIVRETSTPLMGINLGHVGFLAESERAGLSNAVERVVARDYVVKERLTVDVRVLVAGKEVYRSWALNEATVEKSAAEKMLEVVLEIDSRPLSTFGCDGVIMATPTGSTAYAFSAGGPVVWPGVEAILMVPLSAHALFARPLVVSPSSLVAVEVLERSAGTGVLWCDGRRTHDLPVGARVEVRRSDKPVRLARLRIGPFTDRLVNKFSLPVAGWRGPVEPDK